MLNFNVLPNSRNGTDERILLSALLLSRHIGCDRMEMVLLTGGFWVAGDAV